MNRKKLKKLLEMLEDSDEEPRKNTIYSSSDEEEIEPPKKRKRILPILEDTEDECEEGNDKENILHLLGVDLSKKQTITINQKLADLWQDILHKGLNKEVKKNIEEKIPLIENCVLQAPKLNQEIEITLNKSAKTRDQKLCEKQNQIGLVIANLNKILKDFITKNDKEYIEPLGDSIRLLADLHFLESETRKAVILPGLNKSVKDTLEKTETTTLLFGTDLHKVIKKSKDMEKSIKDIQKNKTLNYWSPSFSNNQANNQVQGGPKRNYLNKIRNYQRQYYRNTATAAAPPPRRGQRQWSPRHPARGRHPHQHHNKK